MERLTRQIGREGNQLLGGMPGRIDARGDGIVALQINLRYLTVVHNDGTAVGQTHMEEHIVRLIVLVAMAVDALADLTVVHGDLIVEDLRLLERSEVTLGNLHKGPCYIRRFDQTVRHIVVNGFRGNADLEGIERQPFALLLAPDFHLDTLAFCGGEHAAPFLQGNLHLHTIAIGLLLTVGRGETCHAGLVFVGGEHKVQRCNVTGDRHVAIVREDGRQALGGLAGAGHVGMTCTGC